MKKYIVEHEYDGYEIGTYLKETKGYSSRGLRNLEIYLNGKRIKNNAKKIKKLNRIVIIEIIHIEKIDYISKIFLEEFKRRDFIVIKE